MNNEKNILAVQDFYPEELSHCYGCGRLNEHGHQIKSYADGDETFAEYQPKEFHTAIPGYVYGGLIASLIDCHGTGTAAIAAYRNEGRDYDSDPPFRFVTANLNVDYLKPTPLGPPIKLKGKAVEIKGRKVVVEIELSVEDVVCARGRVVAVQMPENMLK